jgi:hypothetical protein
MSTNPNVGYWMPYHAARAIAATFCYDIRWALTPVFGNDFPSACLHPKDPCFAKFLIDPAIVQFCAEETVRFKELGPAYTVFGSDASSPVVVPKTHCQQKVRSTDLESGYGTDTGRNGKYLSSPEVSPRTQFTPINRSRSPYSPHTAGSSLVGSPLSLNAPPGLLTPTSAPCEYQGAMFRTKRTHSKVALYDDCGDGALTRPETAATVDSTHGSEMSGGDGDKHTHDDLEAAEMLLSLSAVELTMPPRKRNRRVGRF